MTPISTVQNRPETRSAVSSVAMQAYAAKGFLGDRLAAMDDITGVYAAGEAGGVRVTILLRDFWGSGRDRVYEVVNALRRDLPVPSVDIVVLPADAVGDDFGRDEDVEQWM